MNPKQKLTTGLALIIILISVIVIWLTLANSSENMPEPEFDYSTEQPVEATDKTEYKQAYKLFDAEKFEYTVMSKTTEEPELVYESLGEYILTAYCPCVKCCGIWSKEHASRKNTDYIQKTASGTIPEAGRTVGVNPQIIPYGTIILINGNEYVAEDTGSAAKNKQLIDIYMDSHEAAIEHGVKKAEVFIKQ